MDLSKLKTISKIHMKISLEIVLWNLQPFIEYGMGYSEEFLFTQLTSLYHSSV